MLSHQAAPCMAPRTLHESLESSSVGEGFGATRTFSISGGAPHGTIRWTGCSQAGVEVSATAQADAEECDLQGRESDQELSVKATREETMTWTMNRREALRVGAALSAGLFVAQSARAAAAPKAV